MRGPGICAAMGKLSLAEWLGAEYNVLGTEVSLPDKFSDALL